MIMTHNGLVNDGGTLQGTDASIHALELASARAVRRYQFVIRSDTVRAAR
ncbi:MAG: hypothetical protein ACR2PL_17165 [Dehalococcoidia bacterium]